MWLSEQGFLKIFFIFTAYATPLKHCNSQKNPLQANPTQGKLKN